jgi:spoIIIJ-associated protein
MLRHPVAGLTKDETEIETLDEGSKGLFGLVGRRHARVIVRPLAKADLSESRQAIVMEASRPADDSLEDSEDEVDEVSDRLSLDNDVSGESRGYAFLEELMHLMDVDVEITESQSEDITLLEVEGKSLGVLIGRRGETLNSIQSLVNLAANRDARAFGSSDRERYVVDIGGYRKRREEILSSKALELAKRVTREQRDEVLEPMSALERRVVHMALRDYEGVETHSEGREPYRRIVISPKE